MAFFSLMVFLSLMVASALGNPLLQVAFMLPSRKSMVWKPLSGMRHRYGPPPSSSPGKDTSDKESQIKKQEQQFRDLVNEIVYSTKAEHIPGLLSRNLEFLLSIEDPAVIENVAKEAEELRDEDSLDAVDAVDMILYFMEEFVGQTRAVDMENKEILRLIIQELKSGSEERFDKFIEKNIDMITPGFFRHLRGECEKAASTSHLNKSSAKLLEMLHVIDARLMEEISKDMSETAVFLEQLMAYDDTEERNAVLEAGLHVRGYAFAKEFQEVTEEALQGLKCMNDVDEDLVTRVQEVGATIQNYFDKEDENVFQ